MASPRKKLIFSINSGRAGSEYLAELLGTAEHTQAYHEANPTMSGTPFELVRRDIMSASLYDREHKAAAIKREFEQNSELRVYAETNHMFIKSFFDVVFHYLNDFEIHVIVLRRYLPAVLRSFINLGFFSERCSYWPLWMAVPTDLNAALRVESETIRDQYDAIIAYLFDIEARAQRFETAGYDARIHHVTLESLQEKDRVHELFSDLGLKTTPKTGQQIGKRVNARIERKKEIALPTSLGECETRIASYISSHPDEHHQAVVKSLHYHGCLNRLT